MDYEKAYKAVLKTATQWIKDGCTDKEKICLECVFPELRESEEQIIEDLRNFIHDFARSVGGIVTIKDNVSREHIKNFLHYYKDYLEKQKGPSWKPSEEQMKALEIAFRKDGDDKYRSTINSLYNDLKKL